MRLGLGLGLGIDQFISGAGGGADLPIMRRDLLREDEGFLLLEDGVSKIVITFGTFDSILCENSNFLVQEDNGKLIIQAN
tara:strand:- start:872 stop:1111 length:240 start_codon:yes stop_codon:yes gene_type:complete